MFLIAEGAYLGQRLATSMGACGWGLVQPPLTGADLAAVSEATCLWRPPVPAPGHPEVVLTYLYPYDAEYFRERVVEGAMSRIWAGITFSAMSRPG